MAEGKQPNGDEIAVLEIPQDAKSRIDFVSKERLRVIQQLALQSSKIKAVPDSTVEPNKSLFQRLDMLLQWLDEELQMTPQIKEASRIDQGLRLMFDQPGRFYFPSDRVEKARALIDKWEGENWGADEVVEDESAGSAKDEITDEEPDPAPKRRKTSAGSKDAGSGINQELPVAQIRLPRKDHPIWGVNGIMHGVAYLGGKRKTHRLDPRYPKKNAKVYGHNGISVGTWYPLRMVALFRGAHGSPQAGISGNTGNGAYAIVVSGFYHDLDQDNGDILYYSGSGSHDNEDPRAPPPSTQGTLALHASMSSENPVRVLRSASGKSRFAPVSGLRYDGLYKIVSSRQPKNSKGGKYEQFKLIRLDGQAPIDRSRPTPSELKDFERIGQGY